MRKENVHQPLSINRTGLSLRCCNVLTLRQTSGKEKKSVYHTEQRSEAENIWDCSLWHVCTSCNCATIASPSPLLIYYLFTSSIKQQCVWCKIIISCCLFYWNRLYWNTKKAGLLWISVAATRLIIISSSQMFSGWGSSVKQAGGMHADRTLPAVDAGIDLVGRDHIRVTWNRRAAH